MPVRAVECSARDLRAPVVLACALCLLGVVLPASAGGTGKPQTVSVADFYFAPAAVTVPKGGTVKWVWAATNAESHDVHLKKGPKGLKQKASYSTKTTAVTGATFKHAFPTPGTYNFICTIHPTKMKMTVTVKK